MDFTDLVAPLTTHQFLSETFGIKPAHIPATSPSGRRFLSRARLETLLEHPSHWTPARLKVVYNTAPVAPDQYCRPFDGVWRADIARVRALLAHGASIVADALELIDPELRSIGAILSDQLGGLVGVNAYLSSKNIPAFGPHYDLTEVFAFQCEGEKLWRLYETRVDAPIAFPPGDEASIREMLRRSAGAVMQEVVMRPGDALYIPRGWYHDAVAQTDDCLHVTFSALPHTGKVVLRLIEDMALRDSAFRRYLPDRDRAALSARLNELAERIGEIARSPDLLDAIERAQMALRVALSGPREGKT